MIFSPHGGQRFEQFEKRKLKNTNDRINGWKHYKCLQNDSKKYRCCALWRFRRFKMNIMNLISVIMYSHQKTHLKMGILIESTLLMARRTGLVHHSILSKHFPPAVDCPRPFGPHADSTYKVARTQTFHVFRAATSHAFPDYVTNPPLCPHTHQCPSSHLVSLQWFLWFFLWSLLGFNPKTLPKPICIPKCDILKNFLVNVFQKCSPVRLLIFFWERNTKDLSSEINSNTTDFPTSNPHYSENHPWFESDDSCLGR